MIDVLNEWMYKYFPLPGGRLSRGQKLEKSESGGTQVEQMVQDGDHRQAQDGGALFHVVEVGLTDVSYHGALKT